jgi:hypothetical protein
MGLAELAAYDDNPYLLLSKISHSMDFEETRKEVQLRLIDLLKKQIKSGGSTHYLDVDELSNTAGAILIPDIIKNRKEEMKRTTIERYKGSIDARIFYFTSYGRRLLKEMGFSPTAKHGITATKMVEIMQEAGFKKEIVDVQDTSDNQWNHLSVGLIDYLETEARGYSMVKDLMKDETKTQQYY